MFTASFEGEVPDWEDQRDISVAYGYRKERPSCSEVQDVENPQGELTGIAQVSW